MKYSYQQLELIFTQFLLVKKYIRNYFLVLATIVNKLKMNVNSGTVILKL